MYYRHRLQKRQTFQHPLIRPASQEQLHLSVNPLQAGSVLRAALSSRSSGFRVEIKIFFPKSFFCESGSLCLALSACPSKRLLWSLFVRYRRKYMCCSALPPCLPLCAFFCLSVSLTHCFCVCPRNDDCCSTKG